LIIFGERVDFCYQSIHVVSWCDVWLGYILHVFVDCVHVVDAGRRSTSAVFSEVPCFATVKTGSFGSSTDVVLLYRDVCHPIVVVLSGVGVSVILILSSVVGGSSAREVHWYLDVVVCRARGICGVVLWSLLLLRRPLLVLLRASSPRAWSELPLIVVESSWVWQPSSGSDEFNHLSAFRDIDGPGFVLVVVLREWNLDDFVEDARG
jgi:hypothetical protein